MKFIKLLVSVAVVVAITTIKQSAAYLLRRLRCTLYYRYRYS